VAFRDFTFPQVQQDLGLTLQPTAWVGVTAADIRFPPSSRSRSARLAARASPHFSAGGARSNSSAGNSTALS
jgi:hypothetical protein